MELNIETAWISLAILIAYVIIGTVYAGYTYDDIDLEVSSRECYTAGVLWPLLMVITLLKGLTIIWKIIRK